MAFTISCPVDAQLMLRGFLPTHSPHSIEALTQAFLEEVKITEPRVRELALAKQMSLSGIVRSLMVSKYPQLKDVWPKPTPTAAQVTGYAGRRRAITIPTEGNIRHLLVFVNREETNQSLRRAKEFLLASGCILNPETGKYELP